MTKARSNKVSIEKITFDMKSVLCVYGKPGEDFLSSAACLFSEIYLNKMPGPRTTSKIFSVLLVIGNKEFHDSIQNQNSFFKTFYYEKMSDVYASFLIELNAIVSVYSPRDMAGVTVAVFDLDDTIISPELVLFYDSILLDLSRFREIFDYLVLWTHGTEDYLAQRMRKIDFKFDILMSRRRDIDIAPDNNKGVGAVLRELNKEFGVQSIKYALLVDDKIQNYNNDYECMLLIDNVPNNGFYKKAYEHIKDMLITEKSGILVASTLCNK